MDILIAAVYAIGLVLGGYVIGIVLLKVVWFAITALKGVGKRWL